METDRYDKEKENVFNTNETNALLLSSQLLK